MSKRPAVQFCLDTYGKPIIHPRLICSGVRDDKCEPEQSQLLS